LKTWGFVSFLSAALASACCLGPWLALAVGLGTYGAFLDLAGYRPYFLTVAFVALALTLYRPGRSGGGSACATTGDCAAERGTRTRFLSMAGIAGLVLVTASVPYLAPFRPAGEAPGTPATLLQLPNRQGRTTAAAALKVEGMTCAGCATGLQASLNRLDGVARAIVDYSEGTAVVEFLPDRISETRILASVEKAGFKASALPPTSEQKR